MEIQAELSATVWKVVTEVGASVAEGDELVILESMKMEIPVISETGGVVASIDVSEGDVAVIIQSIPNPGLRAKLKPGSVSGRAYTYVME